MLVTTQLCLRRVAFWHEPRKWSGWSLRRIQLVHQHLRKSRNRPQNRFVKRFKSLGPAELPEATVTKRAPKAFGARFFYGDAVSQSRDASVRV